MMLSSRNQRGSAGSRFRRFSLPTQKKRHGEVSWWTPHAAFNTVHLIQIPLWKLPSLPQPPSLNKKNGKSQIPFFLPQTQTGSIKCQFLTHLVFKVKHDCRSHVNRNDTERTAEQKVLRICLFHEVDVSFLFFFFIIIITVIEGAELSRQSQWES